MLLAADLGNTFLKIGLFSQDGRLIWKKRITHREKCSLQAVLKKINWPQKIMKVKMASVVPKLTDEVKSFFKNDLMVPVILLQNKDLPIKANVKFPGKVGIDRLLNAFAAREIYGCPAVVVDCGTALTFDLIDPTGNYAGGIITASPEMVRDALSEKTALLPKIRLTLPRSLVGKDTTGCLQSGIVFGFAEMVDGLLKKLQKEWLAEFRTVATGGGIKLILPYLSPKIIFDPDLTLKGIYLST